MALVAAKCPNCGADLEVDQGNEAGVCPFCNTAYITEKAIVNYNVVNNNNVYANNVNITSGSFDNLMANTRNFYDLDDFQGTYDSAVKALEIKPDDNEALLYKTLSLAYQDGKFEALHSLYGKIFPIDQEITIENEEFVAKFSGYYDRIIQAKFRNARENYSNLKHVKGGIFDIFDAYDTVYINTSYLVKLYKKLYVFNNEKYKSLYINVLKESADNLYVMSQNHLSYDYADNSGIHYKNRASKNASMYIQNKKFYEDAILELDPTYKKNTMSSKKKWGKLIPVLIAGGVLIVGSILLLILI